MITTHPGDVIPTLKNMRKKVNAWHRKKLLSKIVVAYHTREMLESMGIARRPLAIPHENLTQERTGISGDCYVKKELMDVPEIPIIDITEDIARSSEPKPELICITEDDDIPRSSVPKPEELIDITED